MINSLLKHNDFVSKNRNSNSQKTLNKYCPNLGWVSPDRSDKYEPASQTGSGRTDRGVEHRRRRAGVRAAVGAFPKPPHVLVQSISTTLSPYPPAALSFLSLRSSRASINELKLELASVINTPHTSHQSSIPRTGSSPRSSSLDSPTRPAEFLAGTASPTTQNHP